MEEILLMESKKKYFPIDLKIKRFSCFKESPIALFIANEELYKISFINGEVIKLETKGIYDLSDVKCLNNDQFLLLNFDEIYFMTLIEDGAIVNKKYTIRTEGYNTGIDSSYNFAIVIVANNDKLMCIRKERMDMVDSKDDSFWCVVVSKDNKLIANGRESGIVEIRDVDTLEIIKTFQASSIPLILSFSPDNKYLVCGDDSTRITSFEIDSEKVHEYNNPYCSKPIYIGWHEDGKKFTVAYLSSIVASYTLSQEEEENFVSLDEFQSRYIQNAGHSTDNIIAMCVEDLRNQFYAMEAIPKTHVIVLLKL